MSAGENFGWLSKAACQGHDPSLWDTGRINGPGGTAKMRSRRAQAKQICSACPVCRQCLDYGVLQGIELGLVDHLYGGQTPEEQARELGVGLKFVSGLVQFADLAECSCP